MTNLMTPTEQGDDRAKLIIEMSNLLHRHFQAQRKATVEAFANAQGDLVNFIAADRKRVDLEARIDEINYLDDNFQANTQDWEREHPGYSTAMIPMEDYIRRRTELKQELEKL